MANTLRILAVDNEPSVAISLRYAFSLPRYELVAVASGDEALARLEADSFDVIMVDQKMPQLSGAELVAAIRQRGLSGKIIVLSAHLSGEIRAAYEALQVHAMFTKPFDLTELRTAVDSLAA